MKRRLSRFCKVFVRRLDDARWYADGDRVVGDVLGDDRARPDDHVVADRHARQNHGVIAEIDVATDLDGLGDLKIRHPVAEQERRAIVSNELDAVGDEDVVAKCDDSGLGAPVNPAEHTKTGAEVHPDLSGVLHGVTPSDDQLIEFSA